MFLLMGSLAHHSGISASLFRAAQLWFGALPGGLAVAANLACAGFAAASGSSVATAATMGRVAIPEMLKQGYDRGLATGVVASAGTLGSLIPPSILFVLYGVFAEVSISKLLLAGILPGLLTAAVYTVMIVSRCSLRPQLAPRLRMDVTWRERFTSLTRVWPWLIIIVGLIGGLYGGLVTATEGGAFGAFLAFAVTLFQGRLSFAVIRESLVDCVVNTSRIYFVAFGAVILTKFLALTGMPAYVGEQIGSWALDPTLLVIAVSGIYLVLGMFLDPLGLMLITLPIFLPMFEHLNLDLVWFGVLVVKYLEIGLLTPPVGFNVYIIKSVMGSEIPLETIFKGVAWFLLCEVIVMTLLISFPGISLYIPSHVG
jgi:tripartite ATP-independent transporter DctM subunit